MLGAQLETNGAKGQHMQILERKTQRLTGLIVSAIVTVMTYSTPAKADIFDFLFGPAEPPPKAAKRPQRKPVRQQSERESRSERSYSDSDSSSNWPSSGAWYLRKTEWTQQDEEGFSNFVQAIGSSGCRTVESCIRNPANPYRNSDPSSDIYKFWSDCADWPYFLRAYYAWKNDLPFVYTAEVEPLPLTDEQRSQIKVGRIKEQNDERYSLNGNKPSRRVVAPSMKTGMANFFRVQDGMQNTVNTATLRIDPRTNYGDLYVPAVRPGSIRPGTAVYDSSGHVGVVYDVTADGQVMVFDAQMDKVHVSRRRPYSSDFYKRSRTAHGAWFQNFRPVVVDGAEFDAVSGTYVGGRARLLTNAEIGDFSLEMFGTTTSNGRTAYDMDGKVTTSFQDFLRRRMSHRDLQIDVLNEFQIKLQTICDDFESRVNLVQGATTDGVAGKPHASRLPDTIYGGSGEWDLYSTPGGDVRRRDSVRMALQGAKELMEKVQAGDPEYIYNGSDLKADLINVARRNMQSCTISYANSQGEPIQLNLDQMLKRLPYMSFSPWHCIELRWGATSKSELASCPDIRDTNKMRWYRAQQSLRNLPSRDTQMFTGYSLDELEKKGPKIAPTKIENFNLIERLENEL